ncbi:MAG: hypothetical protein K0Q95_1698 [Bacteroidota bacterium]|jgi:hypothetical protein|nr:hypothetical protein [Bacteroidota bacterium]
MNQEPSGNNSIVSPTDPVGKKTPWLLRFFLRIVVIFSILLILLTGSAFIIGYYYQDDVKEYVVGELNKHLNTQVIVDGKDIDFTVLKSFPYGSVNFKNVKALDAIEKEKKDTLFRAGEISIQFNLLDIINKKYHVKKIELTDIKLRVRVDRNGKDNYHFWKESQDTSQTAFAFALEEILLKNISLDYKNSKEKQSINATVVRGKFAGNFSNDAYTMDCNSEIVIGQLTSDSVSYLRKKNVFAEFEMNIDNKLKACKITDGKLKVENLLFEVYGNVLYANGEPLVNVGIKGKDMNIKSVLSLIPNKFKAKINDYESDGEFYFSALIQGNAGKNKIPNISADFGIRSADISRVDNNITLKNVNLKGRYSNGTEGKRASSMFELNAFSADINQGHISGELKINNLDNPSLSGKLVGTTTLEEIQKLIRIDTIESVSGTVKINAVFSCDNKEKKSSVYEKIITSGDLSMSGVNIKLKNNSLLFKDINGSFEFNNNDLGVNVLEGMVSGTDFNIKGSFKNIIGFILKENQDINVEAELNCTKVDLNELLANKEEDSKNSKYKLKFSEHINVDLNARIKHLQFRKFEASDIKGIVKLKDKKLILDPIVLSTMNGTISASGLVDGSDSTNILVTCFSEVSRISVSKMFVEFENFGQTNITDKNIKGLATAKIQFAAVLSPELQMDQDKLYAGVDMTIDNGELNNVESMKSLSRFIELKELENIRFASMKNQIEIKNKVITVPKMEIKSNALNVIFSGTHTFDNDINYRIKLSLNELLSKKAKAAKKANDEFGEVADDGLGRTNIFLLMTGNISNPVIKYDSKGAVQNVKEDLKVEKQNLKSILNEEFGLFKKDSSLQSKEKIKKEDQTKFRINWEEADKKDTKKELKPPKKKEEEDF